MQFVPHQIPIIEVVEEGKKLSQFLLFAKDEKTLIQAIKTITDSGAKLISGFFKKEKEEIRWTAFLEITDLKTTLEKLATQLKNIEGIKEVKYTQPKRILTENFHFPKYVLDARIVLLRIKDIAAAWRFLPGGLAARLYWIGVNCGKESYRVFSRFGLSKEELLKMRENLYRAAGWGIMKFINFDLEKGTGKVKLLHSYEVDALKDYLPGQKRCHFIRGHLAGFLTGLMGMEISVREEQCVGEGAEFCEFGVAPRRPEV